METVREEKLGKLTLRIVRAKVGYSGVVVSDTKGRLALFQGNDPAELWRRLEQEAVRSDKDYVGFAGARARFLHFFPEGFATPRYAQEERDYKLKAKARLDGTLPLERALRAEGSGELALTVFRLTNLLSQFEMMRVQDLLRGPSADGFIRAAAHFAAGEGAQALAQMAHFAKPHEAAKWTTVTYLPFLWRPDAHMFLKPEVTKDFATRVGHRFAHDYRARLDEEVYASLLDLMRVTEAEIADLNPRDRIDTQSFVWVVGGYVESDIASGATGKAARGPSP